jgi:hypothetical protein
MRALFITFLTCSMLGNGHALAANQSDHLSDSSFAQEIRAIASNQAGDNAGVKFIIGNDLWLPGKKFKQGDDWLALSCDGTNCTLKKASLATKPEFWQGHYDEKPTYGNRLLFKTKGTESKQATAWFKIDTTFSWLKPGPVTSYYSQQQPVQHSSNSALEAFIELPDSNSAQLVPLLVPKAYLKEIFQNQDISWPIAILQLREYNKRQLLPGQLGTCSGLFHPNRYLLWAGDLDRDTKPDYLISYVDEDGPVHLFLSSVAKQDQLVGLGGVYQAPPFGGECDGPEGFLMYQD